MIVNTHPFIASRSRVVHKFAQLVAATDCLCVLARGKMDERKVACGEVGRSYRPRLFNSNLNRVRTMCHPRRQGCLMACFVVVATTTAYSADPVPDGVAPTELLSQAHAWRMSGRTDDARAAYESLMQTADAAVRVEASCGMSLCLTETGQYAEAIARLESVSKDGSDSAIWCRHLADVHRVVGEYNLAIERAGRAVELDEDDLEARFLLGRLYELVGERDQAIDTYRYFDELMTRRLPTSAAKLTGAAGGFLRFSVLTRHPNLANRTVHVLQEFYQPAYEQIDRQYWPARMAAADLMRAHFQSKEAEEDYLAALQINDRLAPAHLGLGWLALDRWDFEQTDQRIELARNLNPNEPDVFRLEAALRLTERRYEEARSAAARVLEINRHDVAGLGYSAAAAYGQDDLGAMETYRERAYAVSKRPATFHRILGDTLGAKRQYAESEEQYKLAIEADPTDPHARAELGLMYMQWGDEKRALDVLAEAWSLDEFDARTFNTLDLLEKLAAFERHESENFTVKYAAGIDSLLTEYVPDYLEGIYEELCDDYETELSDKTIIEFMPTHRMFGVRITGKPWIHTVGACTGRVIAMDSPRAHAQLKGPYDVANVLRHEFTHTVTLAASENRIAHWFTEGLAVMQEDRPRAFVWMELLAETVRRDELFTLQSIDWGFVRPRRANDRQLAYAQSEWMCEFLVERFGYSSINRMIRAFRDRQSQAGVMQTVLGWDPPTFDRHFAAWAREQVESWGFDLSPPENPLTLRGAAEDGEEGDARLLGRWAKAEWDAGNLEQAISAARKALAVNENELGALTVLGEALSSIRSAAGHEGARREVDSELLPAMTRLLGLEESSPTALRVLARLSLESNDYGAAVEFLARLKKARPQDPTADRGLAGVYLQREQYDQALPHLLELVRVETSDPQVAASIGMIYARQDRLPQARYWYTQAIYVDPFRVETHEAMASVLMRMEDTRGAIKEYRVLNKLKPLELRYLESLAVAYHKLGDKESAAEFARQAVTLDPETSVRNLTDDDS